MSSKLLCSISVLCALASSAACNNCDPDNTARGAASAAWSITAAGRPATCAQVGAASVSLLLHSRGSGGDVTSVFACTDPEGTTRPIAAGAYDSTLTLRAADGATIATAPTQTAVTIGAGQVAALAPVTFTADGPGKLTLAITALARRSNCPRPDQGGTDITGSLITLVHAEGGCAPVTFTRARGTTTLGTYTVNCSSPQVVSCIERDETLTAEGVGAGPYTVHVFGLAGPIRCWAADDVLSIPAGASLVKPIQLAPVLATGC